MASLDHHQRQPVYNDENLDDDVDVDGDDDSTSSPSLAGEVTIAVSGVGVSTSDSLALYPDLKRRRLDDFTIPVILPEKKPAATFDDSQRKLFQRLWTDEDEIELLQGFLDYTTQRGLNNSSMPQHHYDTTAFYDQIKSKFQLDFNKNQLVEKLRRLKKKYRTVMSKMGSGKEFVFKSAHDYATFEISRKIWTNVGSAVRGGANGAADAVVLYAPPEDGGLEDDDAHLNPNPNPYTNDLIDHSPKFNLNSNPNGIDIKTPRPRKRSPAASAEAVKVEQQPYQPSGGSTSVPLAAAPVAEVAARATATVAASMPSLIEETVRNCVSPIFKELLNSVANLNGRSKGFGFEGMGMNPIPLGFGGGAMSLEMMGDEKWRKQQMLELEVYSKRLELVQDQIKAQLEELRSMGS